jgi:GTPase-associated protein 1, N-terminal domain type 1
LKAASHDSIDQALFGYADGHRQIASSVRLPPKDLYLLSSASDLASGARLGELDSYLSGLPLPESRRYALFRTWAAPEMPRPGCVWSHVLLLGPKTAASVPALSEVLPYFRRPTASETSFYENPVGISISPGVDPARTDLISEIIYSYYTTGRAILSPSSGASDEIENAVLAVWSQQWPRLRSLFSFCTASLNESRRTELSDYSVQVALLDSLPSVIKEKWVSFAAEDAAQNRVTPLRRFLWRYGRDISASRRQYPMLVDLYVRSVGADVISADVAFDVFRALPDPSDGAVLKRDISGIGPVSPRLVPAISAVDLLRLLTLEALPEPPTPAQVRHRLQELSSAEIGGVARYYAANKETLLPWKDQIIGAIADQADKSSITLEYPGEMVASVLLARENLIDADTVSLVPNEVLPRLIKDDSTASSVQIVMNEMLRRDMADLDDAIISSRPQLVFQSAVEAYCENRLHQSWLRPLSHHVETILASNWLPQLRSTKQLAAAFSLLRYPRRLAKGSAQIAQRLTEITDDAQGADRLNMQAVLLRAAIDESSPQSWSLIVQILPDLRPFIIRDQLPSVAHRLLKEDLPHFYSAGYWDFDRRILLSLSKLYALAPDRTALDQLALSAADRQIIIDGEPPMKHPFSMLWDFF